MKCFVSRRSWGAVRQRKCCLRFIHSWELLGFILLKIRHYLCFFNSINSRHNKIFPLFEKVFFFFGIGIFYSLFWWVSYEIYFRWGAVCENKELYVKYDTIPYRLSSAKKSYILVFLALGYLHGVRGEFTDDVSVTAVGLTFTGHGHSGLRLDWDYYYLLQLGFRPVAVVLH
jgi:hypothetical protein